MCSLRLHSLTTHLNRIHFKSMSVAVLFSNQALALDTLPAQFPTQSKIPFSVFHPIGASRRAAEQLRIDEFCRKVDVEYKKLGWNQSPCSSLPWTFERLSELGNPLIFWEYNGLAQDVSKLRAGPDETTLVLGGVHPDEITPIHLVFNFAKELNSHPGIYAERRVVIAPLVNPDGFFSIPYKRTNANGIDLNRNFATNDWWQNARKYWTNRKKSDLRHFPGLAPQTEEGTRFQAELLEHFGVDKVISVHSPLGFLDYDGPGDTKITNLSKNEKKARELAKLVSISTNNYTIRDYSFFPGSLGNYSGNERGIPTVTLELKSTDPRKVFSYWRDFAPGLVSAVKYDFVKNLTVQLGTASNIEKN
jgi:murein peptide amidase A